MKQFWRATLVGHQDVKTIYFGQVVEGVEVPNPKQKFKMSQCAKNDNETTTIL